MNVTTEFMNNTLAKLFDMKKDATGDNLKTLEDAESIILALSMTMEVRKRDMGV